eukprot:sb/3469305/
MNLLRCNSIISLSLYLYLSLLLSFFISLVLYLSRSLSLSLSLSISLSLALSLSLSLSISLSLALSLSLSLSISLSLSLSLFLSLKEVYSYHGTVHGVQTMLSHIRPSSSHLAEGPVRLREAAARVCYTSFFFSRSITHESRTKQSSISVLEWGKSYDSYLKNGDTILLSGKRRYLATYNFLKLLTCQSGAGIMGSIKGSDNMRTRLTGSEYMPRVVSYKTLLFAPGRRPGAAT